MEIPGNSSAGAVEIGQNMLKELHCSICTNLIFPNVYACANGHLICTFCLRRIVEDSCPTCKDSDGFTLDAFLSRFVQNLKMEVPCRFNTEGCEFKGTTAKLAEHVLECLFRPMVCEFNSECEKERRLVQISDIEKHLAEEHGNEVTKSGFSSGCCYLEPQENLTGPWTIRLNTKEDKNISHYFWLGSKYMLAVKFSEIGANVWLIGMGREEPEERSRARIFVIQEESRYLATYEGFPILPIDYHKFEPEKLHCATVPRFALDNKDACTKLLVRIGYGCQCDCPVAFRCRRLYNWFNI